MEEHESDDSDIYADMPELVPDSDSEFDDMSDLIDGAALFPIAVASAECAMVDQSFEEQASSSDSSNAEDHGDEDNFGCTMLVGPELIRCRYPLAIVEWRRRMQTILLQMMRIAWMKWMIDNVEDGKVNNACPCCRANMPGQGYSTDRVLFGLKLSI